MYADFLGPMSGDFNKNSKLNTREFDASGIANALMWLGSGDDLVVISEQATLDVVLDGGLPSCYLSFPTKSACTDPRKSLCLFMCLSSMQKKRLVSSSGRFASATLVNISLVWCSSLNMSCGSA